NHNPLTYRWNLLSAPNGSFAQLDNPGAVSPSFVADLAGSYLLSLVVNDGFTDSAAATMTVTATGSSAAVIELTKEAIAGIGALPVKAFRNPNLQNTLTNKLAAVIQMVERGEYVEALDKLKNDLIPKSDGCA